MKEMKGKIIKKLKTIQAIGSLRHGHNNNKVSKDDDAQKDSIGLPCNDKPYFKELNNEGAHDHDHHHDDHGRDDEIMISSTTSLLDFEDKCPPGGSDKVILYTTSLRGIRKTFEDCGAVRFLLESYKVSFFERDMSLHREFREELWEVLEAKVIPPRLFIKGRYIGGAEEVVGVLNEQGKLRKLLEGIPRVTSNSMCFGCANVRFSVCRKCDGSKKLLEDGETNEFSRYVRCPECNENGLVKCDICC